MIRRTGYLLMFILLAGLGISLFDESFVTGSVWVILQYSALILIVITVLLLLLMAKNAIQNSWEEMPGNVIAAILFVATLFIGFILENSLLGQIVRYF